MEIILLHQVDYREIPMGFNTEILEVLWNKYINVASDDMNLGRYIKTKAQQYREPRPK